LKAPDLPTDEVARLAALRSFEVLDSAPEASFDGLTQLASAILKIPMALVSLVDAERQWFKSRQGLDLTEGPRETSFCGHVVECGEAMVVRDALSDPRFADNPLVVGGPKVRFYAGVPLRTAEGHVLGTLCALDHVPRAPDAHQLALLALLAQQVVDQLEARKKRRQLLEAREAELESARRLQVLFDAMAEGVVLHRADGQIIQSNRATERLLGLTQDQLRGLTPLDPCWRCIHEDGSPFPGEAHPASVTLRTGAACLGVVMGVRKPTGELAWLSVNALPLGGPGEASRQVIVTFHDITALKEAQATADRLKRQEHLITTGTLASGVGHEINNPLAYILTNLEFSLGELSTIAGGSPSGRMRELITALSEARTGAERIQKIVQGLRAMAREESAPVATDLNGVVEIATHMAAHELRYRATVARAIPAGLAAMADESRLTQVVSNLLVNAAQCFEASDTGRNRVEVRAGRDPDGRVRLTVSDNGPGIPPELIHRIFDPFFTTKPVGEGTGLGLPICQSIVTSMGGELRLESVVGQGTQVHVLLPFTERPAAARPAPKRPITSPAQPSGVVLVIDDDPGILRAIQRILGRQHQVTCVQDPLEAVALLEKDPERGSTFDVIFCDITMPHLMGDALYERVRQRDPEAAARFVFISGGSTSAPVQRFFETVPNERIDKPFNAQQLLDAVKQRVQARQRRL
jgi:PAS domain S-box-containing protein